MRVLAFSDSPWRSYGTFRVEVYSFSMKRVVQFLRVMLATSFGFGFSPFAPGTAGTIPAVLVYILIAQIPDARVQMWLIACALVVSCFLTVALGHWAERHWGKKDPRNLVIDEVAGYFLVVLLFRVENVWLTAVWAFLAARFFDIVKPPPARQLEALPAGWGMLLDDLAASFYAVLFLYLAAWIVPTVFGM